MGRLFIMQRFLLMLAILAVVLPAGSCSVFKKRLLSRKYSPVPADKNSDVFVGVVESVNPEQKFVLLRTELRMAVAPGSKLESHSSNGSKASLVVTPERKMNFLSADITGGSPSVGDVVILPAAAAAAAAATASPAAGTVSATGAGTSATAPQDHPASAPAMRPPAAAEPALPVQTR
jgi:hypothetical protein